MRTVRFHFDLLSPFAYICWHRLPALLAPTGSALVPVPTLLGVLLAAHGTRGPAEIPVRRMYAYKDAFRKAHAAGLPLIPPPTHPFNPLLAMRVAGLPDHAPGEQQARITALFAAVWQTGEGVEDAPTIQHVLDRAGLEGARCLAEAGEEPAKSRLKANTAAALEAGVFGVPTMIVDGEMFWGVDSLDALALFLDGQDPVPAEGLERWRTLPASVVRR